MYTRFRSGSRWRGLHHIITLLLSEIIAEEFDSPGFFRAANHPSSTKNTTEEHANSICVRGLPLAASHQL
eukprot:5510094-Pyramimonas_sp.AAC.2